MKSTGRISGDTLVTELALCIKERLSCTVDEYEETGANVYKYRKPTNYKGEYICVNHLPLSFGKSLNDLNYLNVNIHVPETKSGAIPTPRLEALLERILEFLPLACGDEIDESLLLNGHLYSVESVSQPMDEDDSTWFYNLRVKVIFTN